MFKKFIAIFFFTLICLNFSHAEKLETVKVTDYVTDYTNTLSKEQILEISTILDGVKKSKNYDVAVVVVKDINGDYIEHYANKLYEQIGLGNKDTKEGMLWVISKNTHTMRMEVGYGLESILTDGVTKNIQDNYVKPLFKQGDYYGGIKIGAEKVREVLNGGNLPRENNSIATNQNFFSISSWFNFGVATIEIFSLLFGLLIFGINILVWIFAIFARSKSWWGGGLAGFLVSSPIIYFILGLTAFGVGWVVVFTISGLIFDYFISKNYKYWEQHYFQNGNGFKNGGGPAWWAGGNTFGGGFKSGGSGFGGFGGGGFSGGGGSSSSW